MNHSSACRVPPVRVALADEDDLRSRRRLQSCLRGFESRVQVRPSRAADHPDVVLVDPCVDGTPLDLTGLRAVGGEERLVVYTAAPAIDSLAFAMAGSVMDGRLRGWLSHDLPPSALVDALERIRAGDIIVAGVAPALAGR